MTDFKQSLCEGSRESEGGKSRLGGDLAADNAHGAGEGAPVRIVSLLSCGFVHEVPHGMVNEEEREDLLLSPGRVLGAQDQTWPAQVGLDLVQGGLDLPAFGVDRGKFRRPARCPGRGGW